MKISQSAFDLIVAEEVSSPTYYARHYQHPEWPGGASGVTIGVGYDLGYASVDKIKSDWASHVDPAMLAYLCRCAGVTGGAASGLLPIVKPFITIPWAAALDVFANRDIPNWTALVIKEIPKAADLSPTCLGVIVSLAYNRGASFNQEGDRYTEMRFIKQHIQTGDLKAVASDLRSMKRLWPNVEGLRNRRDHEADLWLKGLTDNAPAMAGSDASTQTPIKMPGAPARTKPPATTKTQNTATGAVVIGGVTAAHHAFAHGLITGDVALFIGFVAVLAGVTAWVLWYRNRNP